jgi:hypothetical protein
MPNRMLRESICTSPSVDTLSLGAEVFQHRLTVQVDDFGRMDARPAILRARCFPLRVDRITEDDVAGWLAELVAQGTVEVYEVDGRVYLEFVNWGVYQRIRAAQSKYPGPSEGAPADIRGQMSATRGHPRTNAPGVEVVVEDEVEDGRGARGETVPHPTTAKYLAKLAEAAPALFGKLTPQAVEEIGAAYGLDPGAVGAELYEAWDWWTTRAKPSQRDKRDGKRFLQTWFRRSKPKAVAEPEDEADPEAERDRRVREQLVEALREQFSEDAEAIADETLRRHHGSPLEYLVLWAQESVGRVES